MRRNGARGSGMSVDEAETLASRGLAFLAEDATRLVRFMGGTGLGPDDLRRRAGSREVLAAVLGHLLEDESALLVFTTTAGIDPTDPQKAYQVLSGGSPWDST